MIYITGDLHGNYKDKRLKFLEDLNDSDIVIVLGDFGFYFQKDILKEWRDFNCQIIALLGNHENYDLFKTFRKGNLFGASGRYMSNKVFIPFNGEILKINNKNFLVFGGASSIDKAYRIPYVSWWPEEVPTKADYNKAIDNLKKVDWKIDYFLGHTCSEEISAELFHYKNSLIDPTSNLIGSLEFELNYHGCGNYQYFFGHHHCFRTFDNYHCLYEEVFSLQEDGQLSLLNLNSNN